MDARQHTNHSLAAPGLVVQSACFWFKSMSVTWQHLLFTSSTARCRPATQLTACYRLAGLTRASLYRAGPNSRTSAAAGAVLPSSSFALLCSSIAEAAAACATHKSKLQVKVWPSCKLTTPRCGQGGCCGDCMQLIMCSASHKSHCQWSRRPPAWVLLSQPSRRPSHTSGCYKSAVPCC